MKPIFLVEEIEDQTVRENFKRLQDFIDEDGVLKIDFVRISLEFTEAVTNRKIAHGLGVTPTDLIQTWKTGAGAVTWNYDQFTKDDISVTTTGPCVVRALVGVERS